MISDPESLRAGQGLLCLLLTTVSVGITITTAVLGSDADSIDSDDDNYDEDDFSTSIVVFGLGAAAGLAFAATVWVRSAALVAANVAYSVVVAVGLVIIVAFGGHQVFVLGLIPQASCILIGARYVSKIRGNDQDAASNSVLERERDEASSSVVVAASYHSERLESPA